MFDNIYLDAIFGLGKEAAYSKRNQSKKMVEKMKDRVVPALNGPQGSKLGLYGPVQQAMTEVAPVPAPLAVPAKPVAAAAKGGMGLAAKLGLGGLAAAGLAGGAYYAMNDGSHSKRASAIEGLVLAGYSVEQALQILEG